MQRLAFICAALALCGVAAAQPAQPIGATVLWAGNYAGDSDKVSTTTHVVAALGEKFAVEFRLTGVPAGTPLRYRLVTRYPAPGRTLKTGEVRASSEGKESTCKAGGACMAGWKFESADELIAGPWVLEIQVDGKALASQRFDVAPRTDTKQLPKGLWMGEVSLESLPSREGSAPAKVRQLYTNCDGNPRMWVVADDDTRTRLPVPFEVQSFEGTHVLSAFTKQYGDGPGRVENTLWTLMQLREDVFVARLSRSVRERAEAYGSKGFGTFRKLGDDCLGKDV